jgi:hypothetical protein
MDEGRQAYGFTGAIALDRLVSLSPGGRWRETYDRERRVVGQRTGRREILDCGQD